MSNWKTIDRSQLRTTLLTSLMEVVSHNARHDIEDVAIFDVGRVYLEQEAGALPDQPQHLAIAVTGRMTAGVWHIPREIRNWDFYGLKNVVENLLTAMGRQRVAFVPDAPPPWRPGHAARVEIEGQPMGHFGEVRREVCDEYDLADSVYTAEFDLDALRELAIEDVQYRQVSRYPAVRRDVAFLLPREMDSKRAESVIGEAAGAELESLVLFDAFEGKPLPEGKRNLAFSLTFRSAGQTLTDEEVEAAMARVRDALRAKLGAEIRE